MSGDNKTIKEPLLLREKEVAELVGVSPRTWRDWRAGGKIPPSYKIGKSRFWKTAEIMQWIELDMPNIERFIAYQAGKKGKHL